MSRRLLLAAVAVVVVALAGGGSAAARTVPPPPPFRVLVMEHIPSDMFARFARQGAVGLLQPEIGPTTNRRQSLAALERGAEVNSRLGGVPGGARLVIPSHATGIPTGRDLIVVELPPKGKPILNERRYRIAVIGHGFHGLLTSPTTRIPGLVSVVDVAPTALGRPYASLSSTPATKPLATLARLDAQVHGEDRLKYAGLLIVTGAALLFWLLGWRAAQTVVPAGLLANLVLGITHVANEVAIVALFTTTMLVAALWLARVCRDDRSLLALVVAVLLVYVLVFAGRPEWAAVTPLGPDQNQRFWGIGNQVAALLLGTVLTGAVIARQRFGVAAFASFSIFALFLMTDNRLGANGGGAIALGVALAVLGARILRRGAVGLVAMLAVSGASVLAIVARGLAAPGPNHLRSAFSGGLGGLIRVAANRIPLAYTPAIRSWPMTLPLLLCLLAAGVVAFRTSRQRTGRDLLAALAAGTIAALLANDATAFILGGCIASVAVVGSFTPVVRPFRVATTRLARLEPRPALGETQPGQPRQDLRVPS